MRTGKRQRSSVSLNQTSSDDAYGDTHENFNGGGSYVLRSHGYQNKEKLEHFLVRSAQSTQRGILPSCVCKKNENTCKTSTDPPMYKRLRTVENNPVCPKTKLANKDFNDKNLNDGDESKQVSWRNHQFCHSSSALYPFVKSRRKSCYGHQNSVATNDDGPYYKNEHKAPSKATRDQTLPPVGTNIVSRAPRALFNVDTFTFSDDYNPYEKFQVGKTRQYNNNNSDNKLLLRSKNGLEQHRSKELTDSNTSSNSGSSSSSSSSSSSNSNRTSENMSRNTNGRKNESTNANRKKRQLEETTGETEGLNNAHCLISKEGHNVKDEALKCSSSKNDNNGIDFTNSLVNENLIFDVKDTEYETATTPMSTGLLRFRDVSLHDNSNYNNDSAETQQKSNLPINNLQCHNDDESCKTLIVSSPCRIASSQLIAHKMDYVVESLLHKAGFTPHKINPLVRLSLEQDAIASSARCQTVSLHDATNTLKNSFQKRLVDNQEQPIVLPTQSDSALQHVSSNTYEDNTTLVNNNQESMICCNSTPKSRNDEPLSLLFSPTSSSPSLPPYTKDDSSTSSCCRLRSRHRKNKELSGNSDFSSPCLVPRMKANNVVPTLQQSQRHYDTLNELTLAVDSGSENHEHVPYQNELTFSNHETKNIANTTPNTNNNFIDSDFLLNEQTVIVKNHDDTNKLESPLATAYSLVSSPTLFSFSDIEVEEVKGKEKRPRNICRNQLSNHCFQASEVASTPAATTTTVHSNNISESNLTIESPRLTEAGILEKHTNSSSIDVTSESCAICLSENPEIFSRLSVCMHIFCFDCIMKWSHVTNRCPLCKERFNIVERWRRGNPSIKENEVVIDDIDINGAHADDSNGGLNMDEYICEICGNGDNEDVLLLCDGCDRAHHTYCVGLDCVPPGSWYCRECRHDYLPTIRSNFGRFGRRMMEDVLNFWSTHQRHATSSLRDETNQQRRSRRRHHRQSSNSSSSNSNHTITREHDYNLRCMQGRRRRRRRTTYLLNDSDNDNNDDQTSNTTTTIQTRSRTRRQNLNNHRDTRFRLLSLSPLDSDVGDTLEPWENNHVGINEEDSEHSSSSTSRHPFNNNDDDNDDRLDVVVFAEINNSLNSHRRQANSLASIIRNENTTRRRGCLRALNRRRNNRRLEQSSSRISSRPNNDLNNSNSLRQQRRRTRYIDDDEDNNRDERNESAATDHVWQTQQEGHRRRLFLTDPSPDRNSNDATESITMCTRSQRRRPHLSSLERRVREQWGRRQPSSQVHSDQNVGY